MTEAATAIRATVQYILEKGIGTPELQPSVVYGCSQIGDLAVNAARRNLRRAELPL